MFKNLRFVVLLLVALLAFGACGDDNGDTEAGGGDQTTEATDGADDGDGAEDGAVEITAVDFGFQMPSTVPAGKVTFSMENTGKEVHMLALAQLEQGKTIEDVQAYIEKEGLKGPPPPWAKQVKGGVKPTKPGETGKGTATFESGGYYVALCFIQSKANDNQPHAALGMIAPIEPQ